MEERVAAIDDLQDRQMIAVTVGGRRVLLARVDGRFYATAARCPHWGGSLPDGVLHDGHVTCPLHGGTFDVRSGDLLEPPPMDGIASFAVRVRGADVFVDVPDDARDSRLMPMCRCDARQDQRLFAIIGGGAAAALAAETLRQEGYRGRVLMISAEDHWPYDRPKLSKDYVAGTVTAKLLPLRPAEFYAEHDIERLHRRVIGLDVPSRTITLHDGTHLTPAAVLIATGSTARRLDVPGADRPGVFTLRSRQDADDLVAAAQEARRAVVIGTSFTGMEVAAGLALRGLQVTVVGRGAVPFAKTLGERLGTLIRRYHEEHGVRFIMGRTVVRFEGADNGGEGDAGDTVADGTHAGAGSLAAVVLDDGSVLEADAAVVAVGARPATSFIHGLALDADGGVPVDAQMQAAPGVWAAGDIARFPETHSGQEPRIEHWRVAEQQARAAARAMAGRPQAYSDVPFFWTQQFRREIFYAGLASGGDEIIVSGDLDAWDFTAWYAHDDRLVAACGTRGRDVAVFMQLMRAGRLPHPSVLRGKQNVDLAALSGVR